MAKDFWINLPVKNLKKSKEFFMKIGFTFKEGPGSTDSSAPMLIGTSKTVVMLFEEDVFKGFISNQIADPKNGTEVLLAFGAESKKEVDDIIQKVIEAGGKSNHKPYELQGWMYGTVFTDLDGHQWNILFMDPSKMK
jgi:hypothetical protein